MNRGPTRPPSFVSDTGYVLTGNVLARALGFAFPLVLARAIDQPDFALVYFFINTGFFVGAIVSSSFPVALIQRLSAVSGTDESARWLSAAALGGIPVLLIAVLAIELLAASAEAPPFLGSLVMVGFAIDAYYFSLLSASQRFRMIAVYRVAANAAQLAIVWPLALYGILSPAAAIAIYALSYLGPILVLELAKLGVLGGLMRSWSVDVGDVLRLARIALPSMVAGVAYGALIGLDVYFVQLFAADEVGHYAAARALAQPITLVPFAVGVVILPRVASNPASTVAFVRQGLGTATLTIVALLAAYVVFSEMVVSVLLPEAYEGTANLLRQLAYAHGAMGIYAVLAQWWIGRGRPYPPMVSLIVGAPAAVLLHLFLTREFGAVGAGIVVSSAATLTIVVLGAVTWLDIRRAEPLG